MATPDYSKIWASSSPLTPYSFSDADYLGGWNFLGAIPPDRRMFDAWQNQADKKMLWLKNNMLGYLLRQNNTLYHAGDIAFSASLPSSLVLQCTTAGTTAASEPDFSGATEGGTVTDGSVTWTYRNIIADLSTYAKINSPTFTGTPKAPTPSSGDDSTKIATTAFVKTAISGASGANTSLSNLTTTGENHFLGSNNFTIIYPNGGSAGSPANVSKNSRYVETNPFPGYAVACIAEVYYNSQWGSTGYTATSSSTSGGVAAGQLNDGSIVVQTGFDHLIHNGALGGSVFGSLGSGVTTPLPCRVKVWKIGKL